MLNFANLLDFSHTYCVAICSVLVPLNLLTTVATIVLVSLNRSSKQIWQMAGLASGLAVLMVLHVFTWFVVGVVMLETFVLLSLGSTCLGTNLWAMLHPQSLRGLVLHLKRSLQLIRPTRSPL
jgi:hypothetical protein